MDDPKDNVVSLSERRLRTEEQQEFDTYLLLEEPSQLVTSINGHVALAINSGDLKGIAMTGDEARELGLALIECAYYLLLQEHGHIKHEDDDAGPVR